MKKLMLSFVFLFLIVPCAIYGADKADRTLDLGAVSADANTHQAMYAVLKSKGISCEGLETTKEGYIRIIKASSTDPITPAEIQAELDKIKAASDIEVLIQSEVRVVAIQSLKDKGKLDKNYTDKVK